MTEITDEWARETWRDAYEAADLDQYAMHRMQSKAAATLIKARVSALMAERDATIASLSEAARVVSFTLDEKDAQIAQLTEELHEQARIIGAGGERELALLADLAKSLRFMVDVSRLTPGFSPIAREQAIAVLAKSEAQP